MSQFQLHCSFDGVLFDLNEVVGLFAIIVCRRTVRVRLGGRAWVKQLFSENNVTFVICLFDMKRRVKIDYWRQILHFFFGR